MELDPELLKKLLATFKQELDEQCQVITAGLLKLEKNENIQETIETIFRSAHNIKGAARGIGVTDVGEIAHHIESIFANIQNKSTRVTPSLIDHCLQAVDNMAIALQAFIDKKPLPFNLNDFFNPSNKSTSTSNEKKSSVTKLHQEKKIKINPKEESIRIAIKNLDQVSALTEEIQVTKIAIDDHYTDLTQLVKKSKQLESLWKEIGNTLNADNDTRITDKNLKELYNNSSDQLIEMNNRLNELNTSMRNHANNLTLLSNSLLDEVRTLRLIPASTLFSTIPRAARDIAHELNKQVDVHIIGDSVKMDKMVLEGLQDPIIHLLRNAIDHGIEEPAIRQSKGKSPVGQIFIKVHEEADQILIALSDDGAGIDSHHVAAVAIKKQIITKAENANLSEKDRLELIFRPGFSTKEIITDVSGRGVGLDVVKANLDKLKGHVSIKTKPNEGTTFYLRVPLTLASERGLFIKSGGQLFVIPTNIVERVLNLDLNEIINAEGSQAIFIESRSIPLRTLSDILELPPQALTKRNSLPIIVLKKGWNTVALFVEEIISEREIVIKRLEPPLQTLPCIAGGTLAGNGQVIIVLNTNDLIDKALHLQTSKPITLSAIEPPSSLPSRPHILVVDDSITTRTLEKNILENKNYQVTVAVNGKEAWDLLQTQPFSLLITDVSMPIMDGFTLTEHVKNNEKLRHLPVIIVTSLGSESEKKRGIDAGANAYIIKNEFESEKLLQIVSQLV